jgi:type III restriction enzyme
MNETALGIKNRMSLRHPQTESLNILGDLADKLILKKNVNLDEELEKVRCSFPTCTDFERTFPSLCFALATGVGKTRLMGAFITYLYIEKGIKNFFVLAPNLTVYNKLIKDLKDPSFPKYVFKGIAEFAHKKPRIITGNDYNWILQTELFEADIIINVFNISKINAECHFALER